MGVYTRPDSPWWWLYLETIHGKEKTDIPVGTTRAQRADSRLLAEDLYHRKMNQLAAQLHNLPRAKPSITFSAYADIYDRDVMAHHRGVLREREVLKTLRAAFGPMDLRAITVDRVRDWRTRRKDETSASTSNRELDILKAMLRAAVPTYLEESPIAGLPRLRPPKREAKILTPAEEARLLAVLEPRDQALIVCALDSLMRMADVLNLRRSQDRGTYLIVEDPKVQPYRVPISKRLRKALDGLPMAGEYYFAHRRTAKKPEHVRSIIKNMLKRACAAARPPIPYGRPDGLTFHGLRHTAATRLVEAGVPLRVVQALGGWRSMRQLERYAHPGEAIQREAVEAIGRSQASSRKTRRKRKQARKTA